MYREKCRKMSKNVEKCSINENMFGKIEYNILAYNYKISSLTHIVKMCHSLWWFLMWIHAPNFIHVCARTPTIIIKCKKNDVALHPFYGCLGERRYFYPLHSHRSRSASLAAMQRNSLFIHIVFILRLPISTYIQFLKFIPRDGKKMV